VYGVHAEPYKNSKQMQNLNCFFTGLPRLDFLWFLPVLYNVYNRRKNVKKKACVAIFLTLNFTLIGLKSINQN
jgi:hypothetical protein